ncbi:MAG: hypothetical protein KC486_31300 [Myxococcales bacterium]|nr:hypothetical protein [Myxococcales bacterium]
MLRLVRPLRAALVALVLAGATLSGCASGPKMTKIEAPAEGLTLRYDLTPGQTYAGHVRRSEHVRDTLSGTSMTRSISFDINLVVAGPDAENGGHKVMARFSNVDLRWSLPPGTPFSIAEFTNSAKAALQGLEVDLSVDSNGKVLYVPPLPTNIDFFLTQVLQGVLDVLETAFLTVPERPLKIGESWSDEKKRGREGKLGLYMTGEVKTTVEGFFRTESGEEVVRLAITDNERAVTTTKEGSHENKKEGKTTSHFSTSGDYLVSTKGEITEFDPGKSTTIVKLEVTWEKGQSLASVAAQAAAASEETQSITDPCDDDYVGGEECVEGGEVQSITDPCDDDYVGAEECVEGGAAEGDAKAGDEAKAEADAG